MLLILSYRRRLERLSDLPKVTQEVEVLGPETHTLKEHVILLGVFLDSLTSIKK